jgi:hypothetical protein
LNNSDFIRNDAEAPPCAETSETDVNQRNFEHQRPNLLTESEIAEFAIQPKGNGRKMRINSFIEVLTIATCDFTATLPNRDTIT